MFTEGLDERSLNWVKQKSEVERPQTRLPLSDPLDCEYPALKSPLLYDSTTFKPSHVLPPLKFHSGLLGAHDTASLSHDSNDGHDYEDDDESVGSASYDHLHCNYSETEGTDEEIFGQKSSTNLNPVRANRGNIGYNGSTLNRGLLKENLWVEVPQTVRRFSDVKLGYGGSGQRSAVSARSTYATPMADLGTPSAPPIVELGAREPIHCEAGSEMSKDSGEGKGIEQTHSEKESTRDFYGGDELGHDWKVQSPKSELGDRENEEQVERPEVPVPYWQENSSDHSPQYSTSGQNAWQTLIAYDACIRLCLNAWARGCTEAPDFLSDECRLLRSAFGLHKFLLQPRGVKQMPSVSTKGTEQAGPLKLKKAVGKIRVEVKKIRIIPRRKLKSTYSQRSAMYMQVGAEYVRQVSSVVKNGFNSLGLVSFSLTPEEPMSCLLQLRSSTEDTEAEPSLAISLRPGTGDYHDFFLESQGDALLMEVQDSRKAIQGQAIIPVSSLTDNPNDRVRWWPIYHDDHECVGKTQLFISSSITCNETTTHLKGCCTRRGNPLLLEAAMRTQHFHARNLWITQPWKWLLIEFADYYGVSEPYTKLRYLSHVMSVATPTKDCLELIHEFLVPVLKARSERRLTRQEKSLLLECEAQVESLLALAFESYKSLDESSDTGLADKLVKISEAAAPALAPAAQVYTLLHDILAQDAQTKLNNYLQTAERKTCRKHMVEADELVSSNSDGFLMDSVAVSTSYLKMKSLCTNLSDEIKADIQIHNQHILPSSIDLPSITALVYSTELCNRIKGFLAAWPPSSPQTHVNELLIATADFERNLELWNISSGEGGIDSRNLFHDYIMVWVQDMQLNLLEFCKAEKVPWAGVITNYCTSPFTEELYDKIKEMLNEYEVVINRWPQYTLILENLGTFLNTIKRILEVLHCRVGDKLKSWASYLPVNSDKKSTYGEQMNGITVLLRTKYKNYMQATVAKLVNNMQASQSTHLQRILEETKEADGEAEVRERMQVLCSQVVEYVSNLHEVFTRQIFIAICRGFWDRMGQIVLKFLEGRKENRVWYSGSYHALGILDDTFASQMQRLLGNALQEKDIEPPRSIIAARSILCRDTTNTTDTSTYLYF